MKIAIDVMSGDKAPLELIKGAAEAANEFDVEIILCGDEGIINYVAYQNGIDTSKLTVRHAPGVIVMEDSPLCIVKEKRDSSMALGLDMLSEGSVDAFISAGNTGALLAGATLIVRKIKGIRRAAIATILPFEDPLLLVDSGANIEINPSDYVQFAVMGSVYAERVLATPNARVGLLNNGTEYNKGTTVTREAYSILSECKEINFVGNVEGKSIPFSACDILVTDGFCGNIILKYTEGMGALMINTIKGLFMQNAITKVSAVAMKKQLTEIKKTYNAAEYGGAPLLGISKPVIKAHGSSDAFAVKNAVKQAISYAGCGIIRDIARYVQTENEKKLVSITNE